MIIVGGGAFEYFHNWASGDREDKSDREGYEASPGKWLRSWENVLF